MPTCDKCGKESHNLRVCPYCFTEYRIQGDSARQSASSPGRRLSFGVGRQLSPAVKWGLLALVLVVFSAWYVMSGRERAIPTGVVVPDIVTVPLSMNEAESLLRRIRETGRVETSGAGITVTFPSTLWPQRRAGQLAAAQQYARAVEMTEGRTRDITFNDPDGKVFAKAGATGVMLVR